MRAGLITGKNQFELVQREDPIPGPAEVVIAVELCGICGSDIHAYAEGWKYAPGTCGHEWVGIVSAAGSEVQNVSEGDRVTGALAPGCGRCQECRSGMSQYCKKSFPKNELSIDHVVPKSLGGKTTWENVVCCCLTCNRRKGSNFLSETAMSLSTKPIKPSWELLSNIYLRTVKFEEWKPFLSSVDTSYWNVELEE